MGGSWTKLIIWVMIHGRKREDEEKKLKNYNVSRKRIKAEGLNFLNLEFGRVLFFLGLLSIRHTSVNGAI